MEQKKSPIREKSLEFAVRIIKLAQFLRSEKKEFILADQIMRSGTSIGANVEEANGGLSKKEFIQKMSISYREARETKYWLELLLRGGYISQEQHDSLEIDVVEILKILASIITTSKEKILFTLNFQLFTTLYIAFEGIVGSGKSTQVKKLGEYLKGLGHDVVHIREPGTTPISEDIRHLAQVKDWEDEHMHPLTNAYLYAAARAQTLHTVIQPALDAGKIVVADRCFLSSCTIQGEAQGLGINTVLWVNKSAVGKIIPDIIFYLDIDIDLALSRIFDTGGDKFEREGREFYAKIIRGYDKISKWKKLKGRFVRIDASGTGEDVFGRIITYLSNIDLGQK